MEVSQGQEDLGCIELSHLFFEPDFLDQVAKEVASLDILHQEIDPRVCLENVVETHDERVLALSDIEKRRVTYSVQNLFLYVCLLNLLLVDEKILSNDLHRIELLCLLDTSDEKYLSIGTLTYALNGLEILKLRMLLGHLTV